MTERQDIRWKQRFANYKKALEELAGEVEAATEGALSRLEAKGLIKSFEIVYELAWKTMKDFYQDQNGETMQGSKDAINHAITMGLIKNGKIWMQMIDSRNKTAHVYHAATAEEIADQVIAVYLAEFEQLESTLKQRT